MMFELYYTLHLDDEDYPYWIGVAGNESNHRALEEWCEQYAARGYDFRTHHDSVNGRHQVYQFFSRIDAMRFCLQEIMTNAIITY